MSIQYTVISHLLDAQFAAEEAMLAQCAKGTYTLEKPYVKLNPYGIAPLTALVYFQTASPCSVEICVRGKEAAGDSLVLCKLHRALSAHPGALCRL